MKDYERRLQEFDSQRVISLREVRALAKDVVIPVRVSFAKPSEAHLRFASNHPALVADLLIASSAHDNTKAKHALPRKLWGITE